MPSHRSLVKDQRFRWAEIVLVGFLAYCLARVAWAGGWSSLGTQLIHFPHRVLLLAVLAGLIFRLVRVSKAGLPALVLALGLTLLSLKLHWALLGVAGVVAWLAVRAHGRFHGRFEVISFLGRAGHVVVIELRKLAPVLILVSLYPLVPVIIHSSAATDRDGMLHAIDLALFLGHDPLLAFERIISTPLSEWLAFCYTGYAFVFVIVVSESYAKGFARDFERLVFELTLALALGYIGYSLVPARGPLFSQKFTVSLEFYQMAEFKELMIDQLRIDRDVFPSLHTAITLLLMGACWRAARPLYWILLPVMISIPVACVYLRYHYVIDVVAGAGLAATCWWLGRRLFSGQTQSARLE